MEDLSVCRNMTNLSVIRAEDCRLKSLQGLQDKPLKEVYLADNELFHITALSRLEDYCTVDLRNNNLRNIESLPDVRYTFLALNGEGNDVILDDFLNREKTWITGLSLNYSDSLITEGSKLKNLTSYTYVVGCPQDKKLKTAEALGSNRTAFMTNERLNELFSGYGMDPYSWG